MKKIKIEPNKVYGFLKAIEPTNKRKHNCIVWKCECECGNITYVRSDSLRDGSIASCGCKHIVQAKNQAFKMHEKNHKFNTNIGNISKNIISKRNTSGYKGVSWHKKSEKWEVRIFFMKKAYHLGYYEDVKEASEAYQNAKKKLHDEFIVWYENEYKKGDNNERT